MTTIAAVRQKMRDHGFHLGKIDLKLLMPASLAQLATAPWAAGQFGYLRLIHFLQARFGALDKAPFPDFAPRPFRMLYPVPASEWRRLSFPSSFQFFHLRLQALILLLQFLHDRHDLLQLLLQLSDLFIFRIRQALLILSRHIHDQYTILCACSTSVFQPVFFQTFDP